jgi:hypothetical protein
MPKYGDLIKQARKQDNQKTMQPDNQISVKPDNQNKAKPDNQITRQPDIDYEQDEDLVNLCVKVPRPLRQHWAAEAKRKGITMTEVIVNALRIEFGEP